MRSRRICAAFFALAGVNHFVSPRVYERIVPPGFGDPRLLVRVSGYAEIAGAAALLPARTRRFARWWLIALLAAVFPANVWMAGRAERFGRIPRWALVARLPLQPLMVLWVWRVSADRRPQPSRRGGD